MATALTIQKQLESEANLFALLSGFVKQYDIDLTNEIDMINVKAYLDRLDGKNISKLYKTVEEANKFIIDQYGKTKSSKTVAKEFDDVKKKLIKLIKMPGDDAKNLAYKSGFTNKEGLTNDASFLDLTITDKIETIKYLNYGSLKRNEFVIADSRYRSTVNDDLSKIEFVLISNSKTKSDNGGVILGSTIKDIIEVEVFPFTIPYNPAYTNFYNKISLSIDEWTASSYEAYEGGQFHFMFDIDKIDNNLIYLKPVNNIYSFSSPVNHIDKFTLSFGSMYPKITFDNDRLFPSFDFTNQYGKLYFSVPHNLVTGDLIYISGFNTPNPAKDVAIITEVNRPNGHIVVKKNNYEIIINVDLSILRIEDPVGSGRYPIEEYVQNAIVYFASKRIQIQFRFGYLTNYA